MSRRKRRRKPRQRSALPASEYRRAVCQADEVLSRNDVEIRPNNWQELALDWFTPDEPERGELARYIGAHEDHLGVPWARELLRLEVDCWA
ncbi:MAG: hypothetical protein ACE5OS_09740 [Anaerolineae bacterium]